MNDIKIDDKMKRALDLFSSFDIELQEKTLNNIKNRSNEYYYATFHNNFYDNLSENEKTFFLDKISDIYKISFETEEESKSFCSIINEIFNIKQKENLLNALNNIDITDFPEEIKRARSLLLGGYSEKTREKIKSNIKFEVTEFKHNRNKDSAESFLNVLKETSTPEEVDIFYNIITSKKEIKNSTKKIQRMIEVLSSYPDDVKNLLIISLEPLVKKFEFNANENKTILKNNDTINLITDEEIYNKFVKSFNNLDVEKQNRIILSGYLDGLKYDSLDIELFKLTDELKKMNLDLRIKINDNILKPHIDKNGLKKVHLSNTELEETKVLSNKINSLDYKEKRALCLKEINKIDLTEPKLIELYEKISELNVYQRFIVLDNILQDMKTTLHEDKAQKIPNSNNLFEKIKNKLFGSEINNEKNNNGPKI